MMNDEKSETRGICMRSKVIAVGALVLTMVAVACSSGGDADSSAGTTSGPAGAGTAVPVDIQEIMDQPRYADATWSLLVTDVDTGENFYALNPDELSLTGSTRKLFSVGLALDTLGADHRIDTPVYRTGEVGADGTLDGNLALVGSGDLTFGGRRIDADTVDITTFDHNDANNLGTAILSPQDPLYALDELARDVKESGITTIRGDVVVDDRLFVPYRVPNGNLLISPVVLNENMVDVTVTPTQAGTPPAVEHRPETGAFTVANEAQTTAAGTEDSLELSGDGQIECIGAAGCSGTVSGDIPVGYEAPLSGVDAFVGTFRVEEPNAFMRTAFVEALARHGVAVSAPAVGPNPADLLPADEVYPAEAEVASFTSPPFLQDARLVLKVSLNQGANLSLSLFGLEQGARTIDEALAVERRTLTEEFGIPGDQFAFPTNGSGTPDSQATPQALVDFLIAMADTDVGDAYQQALPIMGVDGSLATSGTGLPATGHVFAKTGTTISPGADGKTYELKAQNFAGYIEAKSGRRLAYALMVNNAGPVREIATDVGAVMADEAQISNLIYEAL